MESFTELIKEFITPSRFSLFGYVVAVIYHCTGTLIFGRTAHLTSIGRRDFTCDVRNKQANTNFLQKKCFEEYGQEYNSPIPLFVFVLLNVLFSVVVCIVYSCGVKSRVVEMEYAIIPNVEDPRPRRFHQRATSSGVFWRYLSQLTVRFVLGILSAVLQKREFYPSDFPSGFRCVLPTRTSTTNSTKINNVTNDASNAGLYLNCHNSVGTEETVWAMFILIANIAYTILIFVEVAYIVVKALQLREKFMSDSEFCQKVFFNKDRKKPITLDGFISNMKKRTLEEAKKVDPLIPETVEDFFIDLMIHTGRAEREFDRKMQKHEIFAAYVKPPRDSIPLKTLEELFLPKEDAEDPRKILIVGGAGIGKSSLCQKLLRDWGSGHLLSANSPINFEYAFLFQFRHFNSGETEKLSLKELLERSIYSEENIDDATLQHIIEHPEEILLVFDGLDEFKDVKNLLVDEGPVAGNGPKEKMSTSELYKKLMRNKLLPKATVVTTSRPNVVQSSLQAGLRFDRIVEILGFTEEKVQEYVAHFCGHAADTATTMWEHIKNNLNLLSLCYIPMTCYVVCLVLRDSIDRGVVNLPTTMTKLYEDVVRLFVFTRHPEYRGKALTEDQLSGGFSEAVENCLEELGSMAKKGIEDRRLLFDNKEIKTGLRDCGLLYRLKGSTNSVSKVRINFCFIHLTLQEFFAAREIVKMDPDKLSEFIFSNARDAKWHLVIQFVAGMLQEKNPDEKTKAIDTIVRILHQSLSNFRREDESVREFSTRQHALLMIKCLYEVHDSATVKRAASQLPSKLDLPSIHITPVECPALVYLCKQFEQLQHLNLNGNSIGDAGCKELAKLLQEGGPERLDLTVNSITDQGALHLSEALKQEHCRVTMLYLSDPSITDQGALLLSEALKHEQCKLTVLNLISTSITDQGALHLSEALKQEQCKLTGLDLSGTSITDQGALHLSEALKHEQCKLTVLDLSRTSITDQGALHLSEALKHEQCKLTGLRLSFTSITDQGALHLSEALKHEQCKLTVLYLIDTSITDQGALHLSEALKHEQCKLTVLDLRYTSITDQGALHLSEALKHEQCKLTVLYLIDTSITDQGALHLSEALKQEQCKLTQLNLSHTSITDQGALHLFEALKQRRCKLIMNHLNYH